MTETVHPAAPDGLPLLEAGAHRDPRHGSCVMEYVSVLAGEAFTDRPGCTHPALAALAWQVNDTIRPESRPLLAERAPRLIGAGRHLERPVRPIVLARVAAAGLAVDPGHRALRRLYRRAGRAADRPGVDGRGGRVATLVHVGPVNHACALLVAAARHADLNRARRDAILLAVLDDALAAVAALPSPGADRVPAPA